MYNEYTLVLNTPILMFLCRLVLILQMRIGKRCEIQTTFCARCCPYETANSVCDCGRSVVHTSRRPTRHGCRCSFQWVLLLQRGVSYRSFWEFLAFVIYEVIDKKEAKPQVRSLAAVIRGLAANHIRLGEIVSVLWQMLYRQRKRVGRVIDLESFMKLGIEQKIRRSSTRHYPSSERTSWESVFNLRFKLHESLVNASWCLTIGQISWVNCLMWLRYVL